LFCLHVDYCWRLGVCDLTPLLQIFLRSVPVGPMPASQHEFTAPSPGCCEAKSAAREPWMELFDADSCPATDVEIDFSATEVDLSSGESTEGERRVQRQPASRTTPSACLAGSIHQRRRVPALPRYIGAPSTELRTSLLEDDALAPSLPPRTTPPACVVGRRIQRRVPALPLYIGAPSTELRTSLLEDISLTRLQLLRHSVSSGTSGIKGGIKPLSSGSSELQQSSEHDATAHFVLRFVFCQEPALHNWFVLHEVALFERRWATASPEVQAETATLAGLHLFYHDGSHSEGNAMDRSCHKSSSYCSRSELRAQELACRGRRRRWVTLARMFPLKHVLHGARFVFRIFRLI